MRFDMFIAVSPIPGTEEAPINIEYMDGKKILEVLLLRIWLTLFPKLPLFYRIFFFPCKAAETWKLILSQCKMPLENSAFLLDESLELGEFH